MPPTRPHTLRLRVLALLSAVGVNTPAVEPTIAQMPESQRGFLKEYCLACHNADKQSGKMRLDDIPITISDLPTAE